MMAYVASALCVVSIVYGIAVGRGAELSAAALSGASDAVSLALSLCGMMCLWSGIMKVFAEAGLLKKLSALLSPLMRLLYPDAFSRKNGIEEISASGAANFLGLGNAATPLALSAMKKLSENNGGNKKASADMITFTVMSTVPISFMPTTVIAMRASAGSEMPFAVVVPVWICSAVSAALAALLCKLLAKCTGGKERSALTGGSERNTVRKAELHKNGIS